jgi:hypothetical protein
MFILLTHNGEFEKASWLLGVVQPQENSIHLWCDEAEGQPVRPLAAIAGRGRVADQARLGPPL